MIWDIRKNISHYCGLNKHFDTAITYIQTHNLMDIQNGRIDIDGANVFATITTSELQSTITEWESHKQYADIHLILLGKERIGYTSSKNIMSDLQIDKDNMTTCSLKGTDLDLSEDDFVIFFPFEFHRPNCPAINHNGITKKIIFKVLYEL